MSPEWVAALTVIAVQLLTAGVIFGSMQAQIKNQGKSITDLKQEQARQWEEIGEHTGQIAYLQGSQGVQPNGLAKGHGAS